MAEDRVRFTCWLSQAERQAISDLAERHGTSDNFIVRTAIRAFLGITNTQLAGQISNDD